MKSIKNFNGFRLFLILISFLCHSFFFAQDSTDHGKRLKASIFLAKGAYIYSAEENFNKQILNNSIRLKDADFSYNGGKIGKILIKSTANTTNKEEPFTDQLQIAIKKKEGEDLITIDERIQISETQKKLIHSQQFNQHPSSGQFLTIYQGVKDYIAPGCHYDELSKIANENPNLLITLALDHLHSQKYFQYNNKSLNFCFSLVFCVRPPPSVLL